MRVLVLTVSTLTCGGYSVRPHQTLTVLLIYYIMSTKFDVNGKQIAHKDLNTVRDFFTDDQWNIIDYALDEYKQSGEVVEVDVQPITKVRDVMYELIRTSY